MSSNIRKVGDRREGGLSEGVLPSFVLAYLLGPLFLLLSIFFSVRDLLLDPVGYESAEAGDEAVEKILAAVNQLES